MALKTYYEYIHFSLVTPVGEKGRKTSVWDCQNNRTGSLLGCVIWEPGWRQYIYEPYPDTILSAGCLRDIVEFLTELRKSEQEAR